MASGFGWAKALLMSEALSLPSAMNARAKFSTTLATPRMPARRAALCVEISGRIEAAPRTVSAEATKTATIRRSVLVRTLKAFMWK